MHYELNTMSLINQINKNLIPNHVAITMDGNGRWAKNKGKLRIFGHKNGVAAVRDTVEGAVELGLKFLTLFAFSSENWNRPENEVNALMSLLISTINKETKTLLKNDVKLKAIGNLDKLPKSCKEELDNTIKKTKSNHKMTLVLALSYSGKDDILNAVNKIVANSSKEGSVDANKFEQYLYTKGVPNPELLIRTSGEKRISNFMLWQIAYSELFFTDKMWPDFRRSDLQEAVLEYQNRERRFGKTTEQLNK